MPSGELGMVLFILMEIMLFGGLISAFLVLRAGAMADWPPVGQPRLPVVVTGVNTVVLLLSGVAAGLAVSSLGRGRRRLVGWLTAATVLGAIFLLVQGVEWVRLVGYGLTMTSSLYGATFYVLIGVHGLHVAGGLIGLLVTLARAGRGTYGPGRDQGLKLCRMYWWFVVGIWPVLFGLVYF
jgi:heme/copper-type cytochrome/quinol oxidase subunit 3